MGFRDAIDGLDAGATGEIAVEADGRRATVDVAEADRLGVRVRGLRVAGGGPVDLRERADALGRGLRDLGEALTPVEVDPGLGGAVLRTEPRHLRGGEYFELELDSAGGASLGRQRVVDGERRPVDFVLTRDQLGRVLDELAGVEPG